MKTKLKKLQVTSYKQPAAYCVLRTAYCLLFAAYCLLPVGTAFAQTNSERKKIADNELLGKWTLVKIEVVKMQDDTEISRQAYTASNYSGKIYFEQVECFSDNKVAYSGRGDKALLSESGIFHTRSKDVVVFQNSLIGFVFDFSWEDRSRLFVLETKGAVSQQNRVSERIRFFYQKEKL